MPSEFDVKYENHLAEIRRLLDNRHYNEAAFESCKVIEVVVRELYTRDSEQVSQIVRDNFQKEEDKESSTMWGYSKWISVIRKTGFIKEWIDKNNQSYQVVDVILGDKFTNLYLLAGKRNALGHSIDTQISKSDAEWLYATAKLVCTVFRFVSEEMVDSLSNTRGDAATTSSIVSNVNRPDQYFTGRTEELSALDFKLGSAEEHAIVVIRGLGGTGKTSLAIQYAAKSKQKYTTCLFVEADNDDILRGSFSALFSRLYPGKASEGEDSRIKQVLEWFMSRDNWLLIMDNADNPEVVEQFFSRPEWSFDHGHILITSRRNFGAWQNSNTLSLGPFTPEDAIAYLHKRTHREPKNTTEAEQKAADAIAKELGYLPIALEQAAARIAPPSAPSRSFQSYLTEFRKRKSTSQHLKWLDEKKIETGKYKRHTQERKGYLSVYTTWDINYDEIRESASGDLLKVLAFLEPESLYKDLVVAAYSYLPERICRYFAEGEVTGSDKLETCDNLFKPLVDWCLVEWNQSKQAYSMHRLVQEVVRDHIRAESRQSEETRQDA